MQTFVTVQDKKTNQVLSAVCGFNRLGNRRMFVDGKFYSDKDYAKKFKVIETKSY